MKDSTKKKSTSTTHEKESTPSVSESTTSSGGNSNVLLLVILGVAILQLLMIGALLMGGSSTDSGNSNLDEISKKVERLDNFFAANAPGYGSDSAVQQVPSGSGSQGSGAQEVGEPNIENRPMIGNANAKITIVEYSDFECPFCGRFYSQTYNQLKEEYIDTGKARLVFKDFPLSFHQFAQPAAIASKCVFREAGNDAFFSFHNTVFENQDELSNEKLKEWALFEGLTESSYDSCIKDSTIKAQVEADFSEGQALGVSGTPSFVINGKLLVGAQPFSAFQQVIEAELSN